MQVESSPEQDLVSELASGFSTVSVSRTEQIPFVFGRFDSMTSLQAAASSALEIAGRTGRLEEQAKQLAEDRNSDRQDF